MWSYNFGKAFTIWDEKESKIKFKSFQTKRLYEKGIEKKQRILMQMFIQECTKVFWKILICLEPLFTILEGQ